MRIAPHNRLAQAPQDQHHRDDRNPDREAEQQPTAIGFEPGKEPIRPHEQCLGGL
jgi:hypothetical protein